MTGAIQWRMVLAALCLPMCMTAVGCRHRVPRAVLPPLATGPVAIDTPEASIPAQVPSVPLQPAQLPTVQVATKKVKKPKKKVATVSTPPPVTVAVSAPILVAGVGPTSDTSGIGALTVGGDNRPETYQKAAELIAAIERRVAGLPAETAEKQKAQIVRVRYFQHEAQTALKTGDADGALTLATKAKLLLDDLDKL